MGYKMKGLKNFGEGTPLFQKKGKNYESSKGDQQGPIPEKNIKLQKGEMDGTYTYGTNYGDEGTSKGKGFNPTGTKDEKFTANERVNDMEERAGFLTDNDITNDGSKKDNQRKKTAKNLNREAQIMRDRRKNSKKK